jgi:hypothetical protein
MSEQMTSQKMKRVCDACQKEQEWELVGATEAALNEMQTWYLIVRKVFLNGRPSAMQANACSLSCVPAAAVKLALPQLESEAADDIDLAALRASQYDPAN